MKSLILALVALSTVAQAKNLVECRATVNIIGMAVAAPVPVLTSVRPNDPGSAGMSIKLEGPTLKIQATEESLIGQELFVRMDARNKNIQLVADVRLKVSKTVKGTQLMIKTEDRLTQQSNIYTMNPGNQLEFSVQNRSSQTLKISCGYGYFQFPGI